MSGLLSILVILKILEFVSQKILPKIRIIDFTGIVVGDNRWSQRAFLGSRLVLLLLFLNHSPEPVLRRANSSFVLTTTTRTTSTLRPQKRRLHLSLILKSMKLTLFIHFLSLFR